MTLTFGRPPASDPHWAGAPTHPEGGELGRPPSAAHRARGGRIAIWAGSALVLGALLAISTASSGPLDDADLAKQRSGMLDAVGPRSAAPLVAPGRPAEGRASVVFFVRPAELDELRATLAKSDGARLAAAADLFVVVPVLPGSGGQQASAPPLVSDVDGRLADGYRMRRPRDGGPPVGYAVVGPDRTVRFRTEDPGVADRVDEVLTMVEALP